MSIAPEEEKLEIDSRLSSKAVHYEGDEFSDVEKQLDFGVSEVENEHLDVPSKCRQSIFRPDRFVTFLYILLNITCTVVITFLCKIAFRDSQLKNFQVGLVVYHFFITFLVLASVSYGLPPATRLFDPCRIPIKRIIPIAGAASLAVVLGNFRLAYCSVGFFQLSKIMITPTIVLINYVLFGATISRVRLLAIAACCVGSAMTITQEAQANPQGVAITIASILVAALYQIWIGKRMKEFSISAPQLLLNQTPVSVVLLLLCIPLYTPLPHFATVERGPFFAFLISGIVAAGVNLSQFLIIGKTSALTFTIVGVLKTVLVLAFAPMIDSTVFTNFQLAGIMIAVYGLWSYSRNADGAKATVAEVVHEEPRLVKKYTEHGVETKSGNETIT